MNPVDIVIANVRIVPGLGPEDAPELADVLVRDGVIAEIAPTGRFVRNAGGHSAHSVLSSPRAEVVDAAGRHLIPGLWDEHVHFDLWTALARRIDLSPAASAAEAAALVAAAATPAGLVAGYGYRDGLWPDRAHKDLLDAALPGREVVLVSNDAHAVWLSSAALARFGGAGHPTGVLVEADAFDVIGRIRETPEDIDAWAPEAGRAAAARGVVGIHDLEMGYNLESWRRRMAAGFDALRVRSGVYADGFERAEGDGAATGTAFGPLLRVGCFKVITDGSLGSRTACCVDPYPGTQDHGVLAVPPDDLRGMLLRARALGLEPAVHAIGDEANRLALDAMTELRTGGRIEHAQLLREEDVPRFAAAGIAASVQPEHAMDDRDAAERYWPGRTGRAFMLRTLLDAGARVVFGSDAPVSPLDPWLGIAAAVTRSRDGRPPWHPEQAITAAEALACSVRTRIVPGEPADLVLLDADPLGDPASLRSMPVAATLLAGRFTHRLGL